VIVVNLCDYYTCNFDLKAGNDLWTVHKWKPYGQYNNIIRQWQWRLSKNKK
jgi:hypothetical protein